MKPLFLQTTPHSGTNTCMYLFNYLGGIPTFYMHFGDWELDKFLALLGDTRDEFVFLHTFRPFRDMAATYKKRTPEYAKEPSHANSAENLVKRNMAVEEKWRAEFSEAILLPIGVDASLQTFVAEMIFKACGAEVPDVAKRFFETWSPKSTFPTGDEVDFRGFDSAEEHQAMNEIMERFRVMRNNDWRDRVNSCLRDLSH